MGGWLGGWVGQWVSSCQIIKNQVNCHLIEIIEFCLKIYDLWRHTHRGIYAGPSIFPWWLPSWSPIPPSTLNLTHDLCALAGGRHSDRPPKYWLRPIRNRNRARMQMVAPRATICLVPSYEPSATAGCIWLPLAAPLL